MIRVKSIIHNRSSRRLEMFTRIYKRRVQNLSYELYGYTDVLRPLHWQHVGKDPTLNIDVDMFKRNIQNKTKYKNITVLFSS